MCSYEEGLSFYENQASEMICEDIKWLDGVKMNVTTQVFMHKKIQGF
jgi:hypothetical protein